MMQSVMHSGDRKKGVYVEHLTEFAVRNCNEIYVLLARGSSNREFANTLS